MTKEMIARINALAKKKREQGLTPAEQEEQRQLYAAYLADVRGQMTDQLDRVLIKQPDGSTRPLTRKTTIKH
jgi:uncharacterized protein YnzC (UPF0291/DUF896 family)